MPHNVLALIGSLRAGSFNRILFNAAVELAPPGMTITEFAQIGELPHYNADHDIAPYPPLVVALDNAIHAADGLLFISPEYNYSVPGTLKNAIDWASRARPKSALRGKPTAMMGGSSGIGGTMRMQYHLRQILVFNDSPAMPQPEVILPKIQERITDGRLSDESTRALVAKQLAAFDTWIARFKSP
jgi:chromate reductase, NAD(P)H dehydrogenase (quinone)